MKEIFEDIIYGLQNFDKSPITIIGEKTVEILREKKARIAELERKIGELDTQIQTKQENIKAIDSEIKAKEERIGDLEKELEDDQDDEE